MTEDDFLTRWSRRKRAVAEAEKPVPVSEASRAEVLPATQAARDRTETPVAEFDPASLPPIDSITALSDITAFLRAGVPAELTRAALRRVWTADPAIRDFVGLAENAWDFTDPNAMPGFGPLESTDEVRQMIADLVDRIGRAAQPDESVLITEKDGFDENSSDFNAINQTKDGDGASAQVATSADRKERAPAQDLGIPVMLQSNKEDIATQRDATEASEKPQQITYRSHGSALPR